MPVFTLDLPGLDTSRGWLSRTRCGWSSVFFWVLDSRQEATVWARQLCTHRFWINNSREPVLIMFVSDTRMGGLLWRRRRAVGGRWPGQGYSLMVTLVRVCVSGIEVSMCKMCTEMSYYPMQADLWIPKLQYTPRLCPGLTLATDWPHFTSNKAVD